MKFLMWMTLWMSGLLLAVSGAETVPQSQKFDKEIEAMLLADTTNAPVLGGVVFTGSSSIRAWKTLARDMEGIPVVNRGFGGSQMSDLNRHAKRIVVPLRPRVVVVYEGDNDLAGGKDVGGVMDEFRRFVDGMQAALPATRIVFLAVKPSPSRRSLLEKQQEFNRRLKELVAGNPRLGFVDVATPMLDANGEPREELFLADRLHLKPSGYDVWTRLVRPVVQELMARP